MGRPPRGANRRLAFGPRPARAVDRGPARRCRPSGTCSRNSPSGPRSIRVSIAWMFSSIGVFCPAGVLEVHRPLDGREVGVLDGHAADFQAGLGVGPRQGVLRAVLGKLAALALPRPGRQELAGRLAAVDERESVMVGRGQCLDEGTQQPIFQPSIRSLHRPRASQGRLPPGPLAGRDDEHSVMMQTGVRTASTGQQPDASQWSHGDLFLLARMA